MVGCTDVRVRRCDCRQPAGAAHKLMAILLLAGVSACGDNSPGTGADGAQPPTPDSGQASIRDAGASGPDLAMLPACVRNGVSHVPGDLVPEADGCGTCVCLSDGTIGNCTRIPGCGAVDAPAVPDTNSNSASDAKAMAAALSGLKNPDSLTNAAPTPMRETPEGTATVESTSCDLDVQKGVPALTTSSLQKYKVSATYDTQVLLNPSTDVIYPGSVLVGSSIDDGSYVEVVKGMKDDITVSYGGLNGVTANDGPGRISGTIYPSLSGFRQLHNDIMSQSFRGANSTYTLEVVEVSTESSFDVRFGADVSYKAPTISASVKANFDYASKSNLHKYMIRFAQTYYTVDVDQGRGAFLYKDFEIADFKGFRPVYVSSIAYGRLAFITLESSESQQNIEAAMNVFFSGMSVTVDAGASLAMETIQKSSNLNITVIGSDTVVGSLDKFKAWLESSGFSSTNTGQIVAYKLRYVDDNSVANTIFNGEYTVRSTQSGGAGHVDVTAQITRITYGDDDAGDTAELYGRVDVDCGNGGSYALFQYSESSPLENINLKGTPTDWLGPLSSFKVASSMSSLTLSSSGINEDDISGDESYAGDPVSFKLDDFVARTSADAGVDGGVAPPTYAGDVTLNLTGEDSGYVSFRVHLVGTPVCD